MDGKILFSKYDMTTGVSTVCKQTKYGTFTKSVKVAEEDKDIANRFDGCYFAELKCDIAAYKRKAQNMRERAKGAEHLLWTYTQGKPEKDSKIYALVIDAWKRADRARETYKLLQNSYYALIENTLRQRREMRERINKKHNKK